MYQPYGKKKFDKYGLVEEPKDDVQHPVELIGDILDKIKSPPLTKRAKTITEQELKLLNYPKRKTVASDVEMTVVGGEAKTFIYFNAEKVLRKYNLNKLADNKKVLIFLDKLTYNNKFFDALAERSTKKIMNYNKMDARNQFSVDDRRKTVKKSVFGTVGVTFAFLMMFVFIPNIRGSIAQNNLLNGNYEKAHNYYKRYDDKYASLTQAFVLLEEGKLEEAEEAMDVVKKNASELTLINYQDVALNFYHNLGQKHLENEDYLSASVAYENTLHSTKYKAEFNEVTYQAAKAMYAEDEYYNSFVLFSKILGYKDSEDIYASMTNTLYEEGMELYKQRQFNQAKERFEPLALIGYRNSKTMLNQGNYTLGIEAYLSGEFDLAEEYLGSIVSFKDSGIVLKDITYRKGLKALKEEGYAKAYPYIVASINYKEANRMLNDPSMILYGEWAITAQGYEPVENTNMIFNLDNELKIVGTDKLQIEEGAYTYDKDKKEFKKGKTKISIVVEDRNNILIDSTVDGQTTNYKLERSKPLETKVSDELSLLIKKRIEMIFDKKEVVPNE